MLIKFSFLTSNFQTCDLTFKTARCCATGMNALIPQMDQKNTAVLLFCSSLLLFKCIGGNNATKKHTIPDALLDIDDEEVEKQARFRFTQGRLDKAIASGGFDVILIGSGPASMACAASLARM